MTALASAARFAAVDWAIVGLYMAAMVAMGLWFARRQKNTEDYLLAGRRIPVWAAAVAMVATSVSAATFLGAPEAAYQSNLTYMAQNIAGMIGVVIVAAVFVPAFFRAGVITVYQLVGQRIGGDAARSTGTAFIVGRLLASGARFYMAAIPVSLIVWGDIAVNHLLMAVAVMTVVSMAYTLLGGLSAVIWTEVPQALLFVGAAVAAIVVLMLKIPTPPGELLAALGESAAPDGSSKLTLLDTRWAMGTDFSLWSALLGLTLFNMAVYATDQDLAQRVLSCRSAIRGSWSAILSQVIGLVVALLFLVIGLLLYVFYQRPDLMGSAAPAAVPDDSREVFLAFILNEMAPGLRGLMLAGLFAAAMSSVASSMGAIASTVVTDFYRPLREGRSEAHYLRVSRVAVLVSGLVLGLVAAACVVIQDKQREGLISFAMGVMLYAYSGLMAVFITAVMTRRGSPMSVSAALITGAAAVGLMQYGPLAYQSLGGGSWPLPRLSLGWRMLFATLAALVVCLMGKRRPSGGA